MARNRIESGHLSLISHQRFYPKQSLKGSKLKPVVIQNDEFDLEFGTAECLQVKRNWSTLALYHLSHFYKYAVDEQDVYYEPQLREYLGRDNITP